MHNCTQRRQHSRLLPDHRVRTTLWETARQGWTCHHLLQSRHGLSLQAAARPGDCGFSETIKLLPKFALAFDRRGAAYAKLKQYDRAISDFGQFIRLDPNTSLGFFNRGTAYMDVKEYDRAIADFSQGIKLNPKSTFGFISRGGAYVELKQYDRAIADYREALKLDPSSEDSKAGLRRLGVGD